MEKPVEVLNARRARTRAAATRGYKKTRLILSALAVGFGIGMTFNSTLTAFTRGRTAMKKVTGIGGIFFKCKDPEKMKEWYQTHLGINADQYGTKFEWRQGDDSSKYGCTQWSPFPEKTKYFEPSTKEFMINYRVENLELLVEELKKEGVTIADSIETYDFGKFVHIMDAEGNKIELWEPVDEDYDKAVGG